MVNTRMVEVQALAKKLREKNPGMKHTEAVGLACKQMKKK